VDVSEPRALSLTEIRNTVEDYGRAASNARAAGFDGVEIHAANGYLIDQFLRSNSNARTDAYGGSAVNRARFLGDVTEAVLNVWDRGRVGVRISPLGTFNDMGDANPEETFACVVENEVHPHKPQRYESLREFIRGYLKPAACPAE
jgi:N-ethylmaleimide reductase